ncbi:hypothetical protein CR513_36478, partial [Mucuna pruriens]
MECGGVRKKKRRQQTNNMDLARSLVVSYVPAREQQLADILTKPLSKTRFCPCRDKLRIIDHYHSS